METKAAFDVSGFSAYLCKGCISQAIDIYDTLRSVRGIEQMQNTTKPTTAQTIVQVAWPLIAFKAMVNVNRWLAIEKIRKIVCAAPKNSLPKGPRSTSPASAMLCTCGYAILNWPIV